MTKPEQARLLTDSKSKTFFRPFVAQEKTVSEAAKEVGCGLTAMFYRVGTFLEAGLLRVTREEKRAGRAIKHYRTISRDAFFIPFEFTPHADLEERIIAQFKPLWHQIAREYAQVLRENDQAGQYIFRDDAGTVWTDTAASRFGGEELEMPHALLHDVVLNLTEDQAKAFQRKLWELSVLYQQVSQEGGGKQYAFQVALVPFSSFE